MSRKSDRHRDGFTLTQAKAERERLRTGIRSGDLVIGDRSLSVAALAASFIDRERSTLGSRSTRTVDLYEQRLNAHVVTTAVGRMKAADVKVAHIRKLRDRLIEKGLSGSTVRGTISATSAMFRHGVLDLGAISRNPCRELEHGELPSPKRQSEPRYLSVDQVEAILARMTDPFRPVAAVCFWSGSRISEALALQWQDIDFEAGTISVPGTKTDASAATVPLLPALARGSPGVRPDPTRRARLPDRKRQVSWSQERASGAPAGG
jgi:integrase